MRKLFQAINRSLLVQTIGLVAIIAPAVNAQLLDTSPLPTEEGKLVKFWLKDVWDKSYDNNQKSVKVYKAASPKDSYVNLAYAVNRQQHNRASEAQAAADEAKSIDPNNIDAILLSVWLEMLRDDFDKALIEMQTFAEVVRRKKVDPKKLDFAYRRIGRLLGYVQGPVAGQSNPDILARTMERLNDGLADRQKKIMTDQSDAVVEKYEKLLRDLSQNVQKSVKQNEASNIASKDALEKNNDVLEAQTDQIEKQRAALQSEGEQKISAAAQQIPALQSDLQAVIGEIDILRSQIVYNRNAFYFARNNLQGPVLINNYHRIALQQNYLALNGLRANANRIANAIRFEENKVNQIRNAYDAQLRRLNKDIKKSANQQRRNSNELVKIAAGPEADAGAVAALNNRTSALSIYDPLPLEQYKADFLRLLP